MTKQEFIDWAISRGWKKDKFGHFQKTVNDKQYRFKLSSIAVRQEVKVKYVSGNSEWIKLKSGYLSQLSLSEENLLCGLKR